MPTRAWSQLALEEAQVEARARDTERTAERRRLETHAAELRRKLDRYVAGFEAASCEPHSSRVVPVPSRLNWRRLRSRWRKNHR